MKYLLEVFVEVQAPVGRFIGTIPDLQPEPDHCIRVAKIRDMCFDWFECVLAKSSDIGQLQVVTVIDEEIYEAANPVGAHWSVQVEDAVAGLCRGRLEENGE